MTISVTMMSLWSSLCVVSLLTLALAANNSDNLECPTNYTLLGEKCYFISSEKVNWKAAYLKCHSLNATLLVFENKQEVALFTAHLSMLHLPFGGKGYWWLNDSYWTGISCLGNGRNFVVKHNGQPIPFEIWAPGEPNQPSQECVATCKYSNGQTIYHDYACDALYPFSCEIKPVQLK